MTLTERRRGCGGLPAASTSSASTPITTSASCCPWRSTGVLHRGLAFRRRQAAHSLRASGRNLRVAGRRVRRIAHTAPLDRLLHRRGPAADPGRIRPRARSIYWFAARFRRDPDSVPPPRSKFPRRWRCSTAATSIPWSWPSSASAPRSNSWECPAASWTSTFRSSGARTPPSASIAAAWNTKRSRCRPRIEILAVNTMVKHELASSAYRERTEECAAAVEIYPRAARRGREPARRHAGAVRAHRALHAAGDRAAGAARGHRRRTRRASSWKPRAAEM